MDHKWAINKNNKQPEFLKKAKSVRINENSAIDLFQSKLMAESSLNNYESKSILKKSPNTINEKIIEEYSKPSYDPKNKNNDFIRFNEKLHEAFNTFLDSN